MRDRLAGLAIVTLIFLPGLVLVFAGLNLLGVDLAVWADEQPAKPIKFKLTDSTGKQHELARLGDRLVVLEWLDPTCPHTQRLHKQGIVQKIARQYTQKSVTWFGIVSKTGKSAKEIEAFRREHKIPYPILNDVRGGLAKQLAVKTTQHMFVLKNSLKVYEGAFDDDPQGEKDAPTNFVAEALDATLAGDPVPVTFREPYGSSIEKATHREGGN